jgi:hypothetical protein
VVNRKSQVINGLIFVGAATVPLVIAIQRIYRLENQLCEKDIELKRTLVLASQIRRYVPYGDLPKDFDTDLSFRIVTNLLDETTEEPER